MWIESLRYKNGERRFLETDTEYFFFKPYGEFNSSIKWASSPKFCSIKVPYKRNGLNG